MAKRESKKITVPNIMYIFCEGEKTEPYYIESFINDRANGKSKVIRIPKEKSTSPEHLLDAALAKKKSSSTADGDVFWVVYDKEDIKSRPVSMHEKVWNKAKSNGVNVAISCVCIEFFILLHFSFTDASYSSFDNLKSRSPLNACFKRIGVDDYDKASDKTYHYLKQRVDTAIANADRLEDKIVKDSEFCINEPYKIMAYTSFHKLLKNILEF